MCMKLEKRIIVYDDYNSKIYGGGSGLIGTITRNIGSPTPRNGFKLIEIYECRKKSGSEEKDGGGAQAEKTGR